MKRLQEEEEIEQEGEEEKEGRNKEENKTTDTNDINEGKEKTGFSCIRLSCDDALQR